MEAIIKFSLMLDRLSDNEFDQFVLNAIKTKGRRAISKLFVNGLSKQQSDISLCIKNVTNIIKKRKKKEARQLSFQCIDELPKELIGKCSAYLSTQEFFRFARTNRSIYVAVHDPLKIYKLTPTEFSNYPQTMSMGKFRLVKQLSFKIKHFHENLTTANQLIWKNHSLDALCLDNGYMAHNQSFFDKKLINLSAIKKICLLHFGSRSDVIDVIDYDFDSFCKILSQLSMTERLELKSINLDTNKVKFNSNVLTKWLPNLKHVCVSFRVNAKLTQLIINVFADKLQSLILADCASISLAATYNFPKLQTLALAFPNIEILTHFKNVQTLQHLTIQTENTEIMKQISNILIRNESLQKIQIMTKPVFMQTAIETIQSALYSSRTIKRSAFFVGFVLYGTKIDDDILKDIPFAIFKLVNTLTALKIDSFVVNVNIESIEKMEFNEDILKTMMKEFDDMKTDYLVYCEQIAENINKRRHGQCCQCVISNKESKINGYGMDYVWGVFFA